MQQFLLLRTPPRFFYRVHGLKHFTHTRPFVCNAICFYIYSMPKEYSFWRKKKKYFFVLCFYIRRTTKYANLSDAYLAWPRFYAPSDNCNHIFFLCHISRWIFNCVITVCKNFFFPIFDMSDTLPVRMLLVLIFEDFFCFAAKNRQLSPAVQS